MTALAALLALLAAVPCPHPHRSSTAVSRFRRANPCPSTGRTKGACPGYVVDHVCPLSCCGIDGVQNLQWQTKAAAKAKDRVEKDCARFCTQRRPMP
jgi:hypothetical protein